MQENNHRAFSCCVFVLDHSRRQFDLLHVPPILFPFHAFTRLTSCVYETQKEGDGLADSRWSRQKCAHCDLPEQTITIGWLRNRERGRRTHLSKQEYTFGR